ncbi:MAG: T9SS type A sorting domain-containing protein [Prevotellaceae bacterium]|jgi:hypothetical protein|nr:T9SS type A sorting domain-containing protein [Prevotellaceae bacterium]
MKYSTAKYSFNLVKIIAVLFVIVILIVASRLSSFANHSETTEDKISVVAFPNPVCDQLNIDAYNKKIEKITLFNANGHILQRTDFDANSGSIMLTNYRSGYYYVKIETNRGTFIKRVLKN